MKGNHDRVISCWHITNIDELETILRNLSCDASNLRRELKQSNPNMEYIKKISESLFMNAIKAEDFDFCIENRVMTEKLVQENHVQAGNQ